MSEPMSARFLLLISLTIIRQIPHLLLELRARSTYKRLRYSADRLGAWVFYAAYCGVWGASAYHVWQGGASTPVYLAGVSLLACGIVVRFLGLWKLDGFYTALIQVQEEHELVRTGVYGFVRHPLHLALLVEMLGMALMAGETLLVLVWAAFGVIVAFRNRREDVILKAYFGADADSYRKEIPSMDLITGVVRALARSRKHRLRSPIRTEESAGQPAQSK